MPPLEDDEEVKEGKELKILTPKKQLTRLPISLAQIKAWYNSNKIKTKLDKCYIICIRIIKLSLKFRTI